MAIVGGRHHSLLQGALADRIGIHHAFILPAVCYLYITYYAFRGSRPVVRQIRRDVRLASCFAAFNSAGPSTALAALRSVGMTGSVFRKSKPQS
jgi:hypothetical protein